MTIVSNVCIYDLDKSIIAAGYPMSVDIESQQDRDLNENDFNRMKSSGMFFARKLEKDISLLTRCPALMKGIPFSTISLPEG